MARAKPTAVKRHASDVWDDIWRLAGSIPINPLPLTIRQLFLMSEGHERHAWNVASSLMALMANCHKNSRGRPARPQDFNPTLTREEKHSSGLLITDETVEIMRDEFKQAFGPRAGLSFYTN